MDILEKIYILTEEAAIATLGVGCDDWKLGAADSRSFISYIYEQCGKNHLCPNRLGKPYVRRHSSSGYRKKSNYDRGDGMDKKILSCLARI